MSARGHVGKCTALQPLVYKWYFHTWMLYSGASVAKAQLHAQREIYEKELAAQRERYETLLSEQLAVQRERYELALKEQRQRYEACLEEQLAAQQLQACGSAAGSLTLSRLGVSSCSTVAIPMLCSKCRSCTSWVSH